MKLVYHYNQEGYLIGQSRANPNPRERGNWLVPASATLKKPPKEEKGKRIKWDGSKWINEDEPKHYANSQTGEYLGYFKTKPEKSIMVDSAPTDQMHRIWDIKNKLWVKDIEETRALKLRELKMNKEKLLNNDLVATVQESLKERVRTLFKSIESEEEDKKRKSFAYLKKSYLTRDEITPEIAGSYLESLAIFMQTVKESFISKQDEETHEDLLKRIIAEFQDSGNEYPLKFLKKPVFYSSYVFSTDEEARLFLFMLKVDAFIAGAKDEDVVINGYTTREYDIETKTKGEKRDIALTYADIKNIYNHLKNSRFLGGHSLYREREEDLLSLKTLEEVEEFNSEIIYHFKNQ